MRSNWFCSTAPVRLLKSRFERKARVTTTTITTPMRILGAARRKIRFMNGVSPLGGQERPSV
jgi:hypothetical protein